MFTASEDGYVKWWDIRLKLKKKTTLFHLDFDRNINEPIRKFLLNVDESDTDPEKSEAATCLAYEPTMPSRVISFYQIVYLRIYFPCCQSFWLEQEEAKFLDVGCHPSRGAAT